MFPRTTEEMPDIESRRKEFHRKPESFGPAGRLSPFQKGLCLFLLNKTTLVFITLLPDDRTRTSTKHATRPDPEPFPSSATAVSSPTKSHVESKLFFFCVRYGSRNVKPVIGPCLVLKLKVLGAKHTLSP